MGEILGMGLSHYPGFLYPDEEMSARVKHTLRSPKVPDELKNPENWPEPMQHEWGADEGTSFATQHRQEFVSGVRRLRAALDEFQPDLTIIFGDDQYENFREDIIPPYCVYIRDEYVSRPFERMGQGARGLLGNVWKEPKELEWHLPGNAKIARYLTVNLFQMGFEVPYAYEFLHRDGLGHAFTNTIAYLDYDRRGFGHPILPFHINSYGSSLVQNRGGSAGLFSEDDRGDVVDPPAPTPWRAFSLGQAIARIMSESPWRVALIGSSSWSHAFLTAKNHYVWSDVASDRQRFEELRSGNLTAWRDLSPETIEDAGEHELLNWIPLAGAMYELGHREPEVCEFLESYLMNSSKCIALFPARTATSTQGTEQLAQAGLRG